LKRSQDFFRLAVFHTMDQKLKFVAKNYIFFEKWFFIADLD
jgi:hypothetical protein